MGVVRADRERCDWTACARRTGTRAVCSRVLPLSCLCRARVAVPHELCAPERVVKRMTMHLERFNEARDGGGATRTTQRARKHTVSRTEGARWTCLCAEIFVRGDRYLELVHLSRGGRGGAPTSAPEESGKGPRHDERKCPVLHPWRHPRRAGCSCARRLSRIRRISGAAAP